MRNLINRAKAVFKPKPELTTVQKLNAKFGPILEGLLELRNENHTFQASELGGGYDLSCYLRPTIAKTGYTNCTTHKGAFSLNPPAQIARAPITKPNCHGVYRVSLSYEWAVRALDKKDIKEFKMLVRAVLDDFSSQLGLLDFHRTVGETRFQFRLPGVPTGLYFLEMSECAGFEFRVYSNCVDLENVSN